MFVCKLCALSHYEFIKVLFRGRRSRDRQRQLSILHTVQELGWLGVRLAMPWKTYQYGLYLRRGRSAAAGKASRTLRQQVLHQLRATGIWLHRAAALLATAWRSSCRKCCRVWYFPLCETGFCLESCINRLCSHAFRLSIPIVFIMLWYIVLCFGMISMVSWVLVILHCSFQWQND